LPSRPTSSCSLASPPRSPRPSAHPRGNAASPLVSKPSRSTASGTPSRTPPLQSPPRAATGSNQRRRSPLETRLAKLNIVLIFLFFGSLRNAAVVNHLATSPEIIAGTLTLSGELFLCFKSNRPILIQRTGSSHLPEGVQVNLDRPIFIRSNAPERRSTRTGIVQSERATWPALIQIDFKLVFQI
jgi:hypothetical protein